MKFVTKFRLVAVMLLTLAGSLCANSQSKSVTGVVKDANNEPVIGASVFAETKGGGKCDRHDHRPERTLLDLRSR